MENLFSLDDKFFKSHSKGYNINSKTVAYTKHVEMAAIITETLVLISKMTNIAINYAANGYNFKENNKTIIHLV